jgi:cytidyltransferase-like protein
MNRKKVFVSGCFDLLHSGHIAFLTEAAGYGDLYVCIGSDKTVFELKGRYPIITQAERKYMLDALKCVTECRINTGSGLLDFLHELHDIQPDIFVVNEDGHSIGKQDLCKQLDIEYIVLKRLPHGNLPARSTTALYSNSTIPFRLDLAGGWLDQPFVSKYHPGSVLTISIEPTIEFNHRSGMASSTRNKAIELWKTNIPSGNLEQLAKVLFSYENPPGTAEIAGSQDAIGIVFPGLNKLYYEGGNYWPYKIESVLDETTLSWLENHIYLLSLGPRHGAYNVLANTKIDAAQAQKLAEAADGCWQAMLHEDIDALGKHSTNSFEAQIAMFPNMIDDAIVQMIAQYKPLCKGYKLSGAGGGGYLVLFNDTPIENAIRIKIRRSGF